MSPNRPLRIALIRQRYTAYGGAERFLQRAMAGLGEQGVDITILAREWEGGEPSALVRCAPFHLGRLWRDWGFRRCVCRHLRSGGYDLVQSHERVPCCDLYRAGDGLHRVWLQQKARVLGPAARLWQILSPYHHYVRAAERRLFESPRLRAVICNSRMVKEELLEHFAIPAERIHVIYSGVDCERFHPRHKATHRQRLRERWNIPVQAPLFLFVGSGFQRKGLDGLLRAFARLPDTARLMVVGKDRHSHRYEKQARRLHIGDRVCFAGPRDDVLPFYAAADALVLPTLYDPFPNVVLEAMAMALPVITSFKSGASDIIREGENGHLCDALDLEALSGAMAALLDGDHRERLGIRARETVEPMTSARMGAQMIDLYNSLLSPASPSP